MGPELLGKGGRTSSQAAHCEHDSPEHEVGTSQRPLKMLCPQISPAWWQRASDKIWGWIPCWKRTFAAEGQSAGVPGVIHLHRGWLGLWWASPLPTALQPGRETTVQGRSCKLPWVCPQVKDVVDPMPSPELDAAKHQQGAGCDTKKWGQVCFWGR